MSQEVTLNVRNASDRPGIQLWAILLIALGTLLLLALIVALILYSKKDTAKTQIYAEAPPAEATCKEGGIISVSAEPRGEKIHIINDAVRIGLKIKTGNNATQTVSISLTSSIIIGRSEICDICIDDAKLSRQHFAIENEKGNIYIVDLHSSNGTMLNGTRINSHRRLNCGDKIIAGLSDIIITQIGR